MTITSLARDLTRRGSLFTPIDRTSIWEAIQAEIAAASREKRSSWLDIDAIEHLADQPGPRRDIPRPAVGRFRPDEAIVPRCADRDMRGAAIDDSHGRARADLSGADLGDADLTGAYMFLTQISSANLTATKGLTAEQLAIACGSTETQLPSGLTAPESWPCPDYSAE